MKREKRKESPADKLRGLTSEAITEGVAGRRKELFDMRFAAEAGRLEKPHKIRAARKEIARLLTVLSQKEAQKVGTR